MKKIGCLVVALVMAAGGWFFVGRAYADNEAFINEGDVAMSVSPMKESIVLNPGDEYRSSFVITNPGMVQQDLYYKLEVQPFYVDENYNPVYTDADSNNSQIVKWITINSPMNGIVHPNESSIVEYTIKVPETAPAGGQYASITVSTDFGAASEGGININEAMSIAHLVLAEVTGNSINSGEILTAGIDSFLLGGKIRTYSSVVNTGNVHALATYTIKVYPLFSNEAIYDTTATPETHHVLPDRTFYNETYWQDTPMVGIFNVLYKVEFQGLTTEVTRMVIICPLWLLLLIVLLIAILIVRIMTLIKLRRNRFNVL